MFKKIQISLETNTKGQYTEAIINVIIAKIPEITQEILIINLPKHLHFVNLKIASPKTGNPHRQVNTINISCNI